MPNCASCKHAAPRLYGKRDSRCKHPSTIMYAKMSDRDNTPWSPLYMTLHEARGMSNPCGGLGRLYEGR